MDWIVGGWATLGGIVPRYVMDVGAGAVTCGDAWGWAVLTAEVLDEVLGVATLCGIVPRYVIEVGAGVVVWAAAWAAAGSAA